MLLEKIKSPADIKDMTAEQLRLLAAEIRGGILKRDSTIGGHVGPNLGFVEATIALHYVFNMPEDRIVFDVSHPVFSTYATFLQRTYDQMAQDLCVNGNPAVINVLGASVYGMNDFTHICFFDIPMLSHIPNLVYLAPTTVEEMIAMEKWAIGQDKYSVALRVPEGEVSHSTEEYDTDYSELNRYKVVRRGKGVALIGLGNFLAKAERVADMLKESGLDATVINPRLPPSGVGENGRRAARRAEK